MKKSKIISFILSSALTISLLAACSGNDSDGTETDSGTKAADTTATAVNEADYTYERVVLIGVDGAGNFFDDTDSPNIERIFADGATTNDALVSFPTISAQGWGSILIGSSPSAHGLTNTIIETEGNHYDENSSLPTIFRRIKEANPDAVMASFCNWNPINNGIVEQNLGVTFGTGEDDVVTNDVISYLGENDPTFLFVHLDGPDHVGHSEGYGNSEHLAELTKIDGYIGQIYDALEANGQLENTLFMVATDHGGTTDGLHGGYSDEERFVFFGAVGKTIEKGQIGEMNIRDVAAITLHAFGIEIPEFDPEGFSGQIPSNLFAGYTPPERQLTSGSEVIRESVPTPTADSGKYLSDFIDASKIEAALFFDGNTDTSIGNLQATVTGSPKYYNTGYYGDCIEVGEQGYISLEDIKFEKDSFSISIWTYRNAEEQPDIPVFSNKSYTNDDVKGFYFVHGPLELNFNISDGHYSKSSTYSVETSIAKGWVNSTLVVDKENNKIVQYYNFEEVASHDIPVSHKNLNLTSKTFTIGGECDDVNIMIDDFIFYRGAMTAEDVANLAKYYEYVQE